MQSPPACSPDQALAVEAPVHLPRGWRSRVVLPGPGIAEGRVVTVTALPARAVPGGEGDRFIVEEQPGKAARCPLLLMLALESQRAVIQWSPPWKRTMSWPVCTMPRLPVQAPRSGMATMSPMGVTRLR